MGLLSEPVFNAIGYDVTVEMDLSFKRQFIDLVAVERKDQSSNEAQFDQELHEGFETLNQHNLISFKSFHESLDEDAVAELYGHYSNYKKLRASATDESVNLY